MAEGKKWLWPTKKGWGMAAAIGLVTIVTALVFGHPEHPASWDSIPAFWSIFGFLGCAIIIVVSKFLGKIFLQKPEDWYDA